MNPNRNGLNARCAVAKRGGCRNAGFVQKSDIGPVGQHPLDCREHRGALMNRITFSHCKKNDKLMG